MQFQRNSPTEILVFAPIEQVGEVVWHALREARVKEPIIDAPQCVVVGSTGDGFLTVARTVTAQLIPQAQGTTVVFASRPVLGGTIDFGAGKKAASKVASALERVLDSGFTSTGIVEHQPASGMSAPPIALATGGQTPFVTSDRPIYGRMLAPKRGGTLLSYAIFGLLCCPIVAFFNIFYCISTLSDYKVKGDPGDKGLVIASLCISCFPALGAVLLSLLQFVGA